MTSLPVHPPLVSVIIPTFNRLFTLRQALQSIFDQTFKDFEIIVVDNLSTDGTPEYITSLADPRIRYFSNRCIPFLQNPAYGIIAANRNIGIRNARGAYIAFLDSDDLWLPDKLEKQIRFLQENAETAWVFGDIELFEHETGRSSGDISPPRMMRKGWFGPDLIQGNFIATATMTVRREVLLEVGCFDESPELKRREDWDLWLRVAANHMGGYLPEVVARYRSHQTNETRGEDPKKVFASNCSAIERAVAFAPSVYSSHKRLAIAKMHTLCGKDLIYQRNFHAARRSLKKAIHTDFKGWRAYVWFLLTFGGESAITLQEWGNTLWKQIARWVR